MSEQQENNIEDFDKEIEKRLINLMEENPTKLMQYFTLITGREAVKINATHIKMSLDATIKGERYHIKQTVEVSKVKITHTEYLSNEDDN
jgi:hypothetical protein